MEGHSIENSDDDPNIEKLKSKISFGIKFWLEFQDKERKNILGSGWANLLECINEVDGIKPKYFIICDGPSTLDQLMKNQRSLSSCSTSCCCCKHLS